MNLKKTCIITLLTLCLVLSGCGEARTPAVTAPPDSVVFAGGEIPIETRELSIVLQEGETALLNQLSALSFADFSGSQCVDEIAAWAQNNPQVEVLYTVTLPDGRVLDNSAKQADLSSMDGGQVRQSAELLALLPQLKSIQLGAERPELDWDSIETLHSALPHVTLKYTFDLYGKEMDLQNTQINLSHIPVTDGGELLRRAMGCMNRLSYVDMDSCGLSSVEMAAIRDDFPDVKVVWRVWFGENGAYSVRTDAEMILASKPSAAGPLTSENIRDIIYCTDVRFLDLGHNGALDDISFVEYMPKLQVAIFAMCSWSDASPLANCTELEYLEMQTTNCTDLSPLSGLDKLRHLNVASIIDLCDISPLYSLTELDRLWIGCYNRVPDEQIELMRAAAPDCEINTTVYKDPTAEKWRYDGYLQVPRYYLLRLQFEGYENSSYSFAANDPLS